MSLDHLWAGWRMTYVASASDEASSEPSGDDGCVFCTIVSGDEPDQDRLVVFEGAKVAVVLNAFPYASGHLMVMPTRHVRELEELDDGEAGELWGSVQRAVSAQKAAYRPDGCNIGVNLGRAAGAGIPGHLHVHVVPRWIGDTNFMTSTASVRVLPEALGDSWARLKEAWR